MRERQSHDRRSSISQPQAANLQSLISIVTDSLLLSRYKLTTFLACQRRFELRYLQKLPWPQRPLSVQDEDVLARGQAFHQVLQRHFLGWEVEPATIGDAQVRQWYLLFQNSKLQLPQGRVLTEMSLTIPLGQHLLNGRFDLLILGTNEQGEPTAHLFDWKTGKAQDSSKLKHDWQTRLYLAMLAEGGAALFAQQQAQLKPENISITYWYVTEPDAPRTLTYSSAQHAENWADLQMIASQIDAQFAQNDWPKTDDLSECQRCAYQMICQRQAAGTAVPILDEDAAELFDDWETAVPDFP